MPDCMARTDVLLSSGVPRSSACLSACLALPSPPACLSSLVQPRPHARARVHGAGYRTEPGRRQPGGARARGESARRAGEVRYFTDPGSGARGRRTKRPKERSQHARGEKEGPGDAEGALLSTREPHFSQNNINTGPLARCRSPHHVASFTCSISQPTPLSRQLPTTSS